MDYALYTISKRGVFTQKYDIYRDGTLLYTVAPKTHLFKIDRHFFDHTGHEVLYITKPSTWRQTYELYKDDLCVGEVTSGSMTGKCTFNFGHQVLKTKVNAFASSITILDDDVEVGKLSRNVLRSKHGIGIALSKDYDQLLVLGALLCQLLILDQYQS